MPERVIAITGGTGFIGRRLVDAHRKTGDAVRVLTRREPIERLPGVTYVTGDVATADERSVNSLLDGADVFYHCAGELRDEGRMHAVHVGGTQRLLRAVNNSAIRWVQLSSVGVYGPYRSGVVTEKAAAAPIGVYERTKADADELVLSACAAGKIDAVVLRPSIVIGADMPSPWLRSLCATIERRVFAYIGRPGALINYVGVDDVARSLRAAADVAHPASRVYNLSCSDTIEALVTHLARAVGVKPPTRRTPEWVARSAASVAGWAPRFPLTRQRVNALTNTAVYSSALAAAELDFTPREALETLCRDIVAKWRRSGIAPA